MTNQIKVPEPLDLRPERVQVGDSAEFLTKFSSTQSKLETFSDGLSVMADDLGELIDNMTELEGNVVETESSMQLLVSEVKQSSASVRQNKEEAAALAALAAHHAGSIEDAVLLLKMAPLYRGNYADILSASEAVSLSVSSVIFYHQDYWILNRNLPDARQSVPSSSNQDWALFRLHASTMEPVLSAVLITVEEYSSAEIMISNYDENLSYEIRNEQSNIINVARSGDKITIQPLAITTDMTAEFSIRSLASGLKSSAEVNIVVNLVHVAVHRDTPSVLTPTNGIQGLSLQPVVTASAYSTNPENYDVHAYSQCLVRNTDGSAVWDSGEITATTQFAVDTDLPAESDLDILVRYKGSKLGWGQWSEPVQVTTQAADGIGAVRSDGWFGGPIVEGWRLTIAPRSLWGNKPWGLRGVSLPLFGIGNPTGSDPWSGHKNTTVLLHSYSDVSSAHGNTGPVAAVYCKSIHDDAFLPNMQELRAIMDVSDRIGAFDGIAGSQMFWSSTTKDNGSAWVFSKMGTNSGWARNDAFLTIPVRRVPV